MKLRKAWYFSPFTEVAGKGRKPFLGRGNVRRASRECLTLRTFIGWGVGIRWLDRSEKEWRQNLGSEEEYHLTAYGLLNSEP
jgi:hypothetical protein